MEEEEEARRGCLEQKSIGDKQGNDDFSAAELLGGLFLAENAAYIFPYGACNDSCHCPSGPPLCFSEVSFY